MRVAAKSQTSFCCASAASGRRFYCHRVAVLVSKPPRNGWNVHAASDAARCEQMPQVVMRAVLVDEGDFVEAGQVLANIQSDTLQAQLAEAEAQHPGYRKL